MVRTLQPFKLSKMRKVRCKTLSGARVEEVFETTKSLANAFHVSELILHVGTNNVATCENSLIEKQIESLCDQVLADCPSATSITISSIIQRKIFQNDLREKTIELNKLLRALTHRRGWGFIDNSSIDPSTHLVNDGVHLNVNGTKTFASLLSAHIDRRSATDKPSTASQDMFQPHRHASPLYEDITSPPARRSYADIASQSPVPPISRYPERHWSEVYRGNMPSTGDLYARNSSGGYTHQRSTMNEQGYHGYTYAYTGCFNCGERNHKRANCRYADKLRCATCGQWGHKSNLCTARNGQI